MKHKLIVTLEYEEEWDETDPDNVDCDDYTFDDWSDCDWDNVGRPLDRMIDTGWKIKKKQIK